MLDWDISIVYYKILVKFIFQNFTTMHKTWLGTKNLHHVEYFVGLGVDNASTF
jgi:hypothetical protein